MCPCVQPAMVIWGSHARLLVRLSHCYFSDANVMWGCPNVMSGGTASLRVPTNQPSVMRKLHKPCTWFHSVDQHG